MLTRLKVGLQYCLPQQTLSRVIGWFADARLGVLTRMVIRLFVWVYKVDMREAQHEDIAHYRSFNHFFCRALKAEARQFTQHDQTILSPADGVISQCGQIHGKRIFQAKGKNFSLVQLLGGNQKMAALFTDGYFATVYLSPKDYHRVHMPVSGELVEMAHVPGSLFSVNGGTTKYVDGLFARNERLVCLFETAQGPMVMVLVGAMIVASIETVWAGTVVPVSKNVIRRWQYEGKSDMPKTLVSLLQGEEMGRFKLGSTVIMCFPKDRMAWQSDIEPGTALKVGQVMGHRTKTS